jgi:hypothetical protein
MTAWDDDDDGYDDGDGDNAQTDILTELRALEGLGRPAVPR